MARQGGILKIKGTIGGITFYKSSLDGHLLREKGGVSGDRIANDPAFARTRENGQEFGNSCNCSKYLRDALRTLMMNAADTRVSARLTQRNMQILKMDTVSERGARTVNSGLATAEGKDLLVGFNFNINANTDDGSCVPVIIGCTDATALNFDSLANTNNGCIYPIYGCTDPLAFNFNLYANSDDGSCIPVVIGCTDATALNYDSTANVNNGCVYPILGCTNPTQFNYDPLANTDDGSCVPYIYGCTDNTMFNYAPAANTENGSCIPFVYGCTDSTAFNYDPLANTDNNTCIVYVYGCTNPIALNYDSLAGQDDGSCQYLLGCTDPVALNFDSLAGQDDGSCQYLQGCMNPNAANYDSTAQQLPNGLIAPGGSCNLTSWDQNYFGIDSTDYWNDPSLWSPGTRIYISGQQWFVDGVNFPTNCNAPAVLIYIVPTEAQADGNTGTFVPGLNVNAVVLPSPLKLSLVPCPKTLLGVTPIYAILCYLHNTHNSIQTLCCV